MIVRRAIQENVEKAFFQGKIVIIYGARQVGKTTLLRRIQSKYDNDALYFNCDEPFVRQSLQDASSGELKTLFAGKKVVFIDEAQRVKNIGLTLKLAVDTLPETQVVATGSSSFELANEVSEPLTGRVYEFYLYPLSVQEIFSENRPADTQGFLRERMVLGMYPGIVYSHGDIKRELSLIAGSYLYKDILAYDKIRHPDVLEQLLQALALQVGNEVSYHELSVLLKRNVQTIENYIQILEKAFIIFRLRPLSRNLRNEISRSRKVYFCDVGIRNVLVNNLNPIEMRDDVGALWENFCIVERMKRNHNKNIFPAMYFWRTHRQQEVDYIEEDGGMMAAYECKWNEKKSSKCPKAFSQAYPGTAYETINRKNFESFIIFSSAEK